MIHFKIVLAVAFSFYSGMVNCQLPEQKDSSDFGFEILNNAHRVYKKFNSGSFTVQEKYKSSLSKDTSVGENYYVFQRNDEGVHLRLEHPEAGTVKILDDKQLYLLVPPDTTYGNDELAVSFEYEDRTSLFPSYLFDELPFLYVDFFFFKMRTSLFEVEKEGRYYVLRSKEYRFYINRSTYLIERVIVNITVPKFGVQYKELNIISQVRDSSLHKPTTFSIKGKKVIPSEAYFKMRDTEREKKQIQHVDLNFQLLDFPSGDSINLTESNKDLYLLEFWFVSCYPCWQSTTTLNKVYQSLDSNRVALIAVNLSLNDSDDSIQNYIDKNKVNYQITRDIHQRLSKAIGVNGVPYFVIVDRNGNIHFRHSGTIEEENLQKAISKAMHDFRMNPNMMNDN